MTTELEVQNNIDLALTEEEKQERKEKMFDPREEIMKQIAEKRAKQVAEESGFEGVDIPAEQIENEEKEELPAEETKTEEKVTEVEPVKKEEKNEDAKQEQKRVVLTVNGQNLEVSEQELIAMAQKGIGAEQKFQEAARMRQEAERLAQLRQQSVPAHPQQKDDRAQEPEADKTLLREIAHKISYGSEEEGAEAIQKLVGLVSNSQQRRPEGPSPEQLVQIATQNAVAHIQFQKNLEDIVKDYSDIFESEDKTILAANKVLKLRQAYAQAGVPKTEYALYKEACDTTRSLFIAEKPEEVIKEEPKTTVQAAVSSQKLERKRAAPTTVSAASKVAQMEEKKYVTGSDIVANMRKSRGQAVY